MIFLGKKITLEFEFGKSTFILIAVAVIVGYAIGNFYPFVGFGYPSVGITSLIAALLSSQKQEGGL